MCIRLASTLEDRLIYIAMADTRSVSVIQGSSTSLLIGCQLFRSHSALHGRTDVCPPPPFPLRRRRLTTGPIIIDLRRLIAETGDCVA